MDTDYCGLYIVSVCLCNPKFMRGEQVHADLFSTSQGHRTEEKEGKWMLLSLLLYQSDTDII
jgi:hypothetical protein